MAANVDEKIFEEEKNKLIAALDAVERVISSKLPNPNDLLPFPINEDFEKLLREYLEFIRTQKNTLKTLGHDQIKIQTFSKTLQDSTTNSANKSENDNPLDLNKDETTKLFTGLTQACETFATNAKAALAMPAPPPDSLKDSKDRLLQKIQDLRDTEIKALSKVLGKDTEEVGKSLEYPEFRTSLFDNSEKQKIFLTIHKLESLKEKITDTTDMSDLSNFEKKISQIEKKSEEAPDIDPEKFNTLKQQLKDLLEDLDEADKESLLDTLYGTNTYAQSKTIDPFATAKNTTELKSLVSSLKSKAEDLGFEDTADDVKNILNAMDTKLEEFLTADANTPPDTLDATQKKLLQKIEALRQKEIEAFCTAVNLTLEEGKNKLKDPEFRKTAGVAETTKGNISKLDNLDELEKKVTAAKDTDVLENLEFEMFGIEPLFDPPATPNAATPPAADLPNPAILQNLKDALRKEIEKLKSPTFDEIILKHPHQHKHPITTATSFEEIQDFLKFLKSKINEDKSSSTSGSKEEKNLQKWLVALDTMDEMVTKAIADDLAEKNSIKGFSNTVDAESLGDGNFPKKDYETVIKKLDKSSSKNILFIDNDPGKGKKGRGIVEFSGNSHEISQNLKNFLDAYKDPKNKISPQRPLIHTVNAPPSATPEMINKYLKSLPTSPRVTWIKMSDGSKVSLDAWQKNHQPQQAAASNTAGKAITPLNDLTQEEEAKKATAAKSATVDPPTPGAATPGSTKTKNLTPPAPRS